MRLRHILLYEKFNLEEFMEDPDKHIHDDSDDIVDIGTYVTSYRGPGQVVGIDGNFWIVKLLDSSKKEIKVPMDLVIKITRAEADEHIKRGSGFDSTVELNKMANDLESFIEANLRDDPESEDHMSFMGDITRSFDLIEEILVDLISIKNRDSYMSTRSEYGRLLSYLAFLFEGMLEKTDSNIEVGRKIDSIVKEFKKL